MTPKTTKTNKTKTTDGSTKTWAPPTRRVFFAMIGAAAAALALRQQQEAEPPRSTWTGTTRWIGHC